MTIRDLIHRESETDLAGLAIGLNDNLEEMKAWRKGAEKLKSVKEMYDIKKGYIRGMISALYLTHVITEAEFMEILEDIKQNY